MCGTPLAHTLALGGFAEPIKATSKNLARKRPARSYVLLAAPPKHAQPVLPHSATGVRFCHAVPLVLQMLGPLVACTHVCMRSVLDEPTRPCPAVMNPGPPSTPRAHALAARILGSRAGRRIPGIRGVFWGFLRFPACRRVSSRSARVASRGPRDSGDSGRFLGIPAVFWGRGGRASLVPALPVSVVVAVLGRAHHVFERVQGPLCALDAGLGQPPHFVAQL